MSDSKSDPKVEIGIWAGIPLVILILFVVALDNSKEISAKNQTLKRKASDYEKYYLNKDAVVPFEQALSNNRKQLTEQQSEYDKVVERMMPALPSAYLTDNYTKASARATEDLEAVRKLAERTGVALPKKLPNDDALDVNPAVYSLQLAHLYLFRNALEMLIKDASSGKLNILAVAVNKESGKTDASGEIALLTLDITLHVDFRSLERILRTFNNNKLGIAIRMLDLEVPDKKRPSSDVPYMKANMTVSLLTPNDAAWGLVPLGTAEMGNAASTDSSTRSVRGGRF